MLARCVVVAMGLFWVACGGTIDPERAACEVAKRDCPSGESTIEACVEGLMMIEARSDEAGCSAEYDAMIACYGATRFQCSGDNWPDCQEDEDAWSTCCEPVGGCRVP